MCYSQWLSILGVYTDQTFVELFFVNHRINIMSFDMVRVKYYCAKNLVNFFLISLHHYWHCKYSWSDYSHYWHDLMKQSSNSTIRCTCKNLCKFCAQVYLYTFPFFVQTSIHSSVFDTICYVWKIPRRWKPMNLLLWCLIIQVDYARMLLFQ